jgi:ACR3 family arsenite transporter
MNKEERGISFFEKYLTVWVLFCIAGGIALGKVFPMLAQYLDGLSIYVGEAPVVSIPIAVCLFFMMYPIMVKIDFAEVVQAGKTPKPVMLTLFANWIVKPFTMYAIAIFFLGFLFKNLIGADAIDIVKLPPGAADWAVGTVHGAGNVVMQNGMKMLAIPLWRSYLAGCILLGIAPCTAMVLVWGYLARGNDGHTLVMVAINSLTMLVLYGVLGGFLLGVGRLPVPWQALLLSIGIYVALPLVTGYFSRKWIIKSKGEDWFKEKFLHLLTPVSISALLITLVLLFSFKGDIILSRPLTILWIAIPLFIQTNLIFWITYGLAKVLKLSYEDAAPSAMIGASNHFEVAIATSTMLFGLSSGASLATVVGVLIEVPVMLMLVRICLRTQTWFRIK